MHTYNQKENLNLDFVVVLNELTKLVNGGRKLIVLLLERENNVFVRYFVALIRAVLLLQYKDYCNSFRLGIYFLFGAAAVFGIAFFTGAAFLGFGVSGFLAAAFGFVDFS